MLGLYRRLKQRGILSINQRNMDFVLKYNPRRLYPLVDDKLQTKLLAEKAGIAAPPLYTLIKSEHQLKHLDEILAPWPDFVIKPAHGAGGDGIIVVQDRVMGRYRQINGRSVPISVSQSAYAELLPCQRGSFQNCGWQ